MYAFHAAYTQMRGGAEFAALGANKCDQDRAYEGSPAKAREKRTGEESRENGVQTDDLKKVFFWPTIGTNATSSKIVRIEAIRGLT
jgi:hypothetical protein